MEETNKSNNPLRQRLYSLADEIIRMQCVDGVVSLNTFSKKTENSVGWIKNFNATKIAPKTLGAIRRNFPMVNVNWLVTGEGNMFVEDFTPCPVVAPNNVDDKVTLEAQVAVLFQQVANLLEQNRKLSDKISELERKSGNLS